MNDSLKRSMALVCFVGSAVSATAGDGVGPLLAEFQSGNVRHVGHIYYNIATGERITTLMQSDQQAGVGGDLGDGIWVSTKRAQCSDQGNTTTYFFEMDYTSLTSGAMEYFGGELYDWGDIAADTVVDCVQVHWVTDHVDTDLDGDGAGDGVVGFGATWTFWDGMNGRAPQMFSIARPIIEFTLSSLPGEISDPGDSFIAFYTADIDLAGSFGSSLVFEIGDTDSDLQGAAVHNPRMDLMDADGDGISDLDPDEDGLADWGWSITYHQPGTVDFDNADQDSDPLTGVDGDPNNRGTTGVMFGSPNPGIAEFDSVTGEWNYVATGSNGEVVEDLFTVSQLFYISPWVPGGWELFDAVNFGGLECVPGGSYYTPAAHFMVTLYQVSTLDVCKADLNEDGFLDFLDISIFVSTFPDYNGDTVFDFLDISAFINDFGNGCAVP